MSVNEKLNIVHNDLSERISYWTKEADLCQIEIFGILESIKMDVRDSFELNEEEEG